MLSVGQLEDLLSGNQIATILNCKSSLVANQKLVNCLIEKVPNKTNILDFCDHLERIQNASQLHNTVKHLRKGLSIIRACQLRMYVFFDINV